MDNEQTIKLSELSKLFRESGISFVHDGNYTMSLCNVMTAIAGYDGEINAILEHKELTHLAWKSCEPQTNFLSNDEKQLFAKAKSYETFWNWDCFNKSDSALDIMIEREAVFNSYPERRKRANVFLRNEGMRNNVFDQKGDKCVNCGTSKEVGLDHIISVFKGGEDSFDNLQPMCRSCNSSKGIK